MSSLRAAAYSNIYSIRILQACPVGPYPASTEQGGCLIVAFAPSAMLPTTRTLPSSELFKEPSRAAREQGGRRTATRHIKSMGEEASTAQRRYRVM
ncbi:MAG: hypothetical protein ACFCVA_00510 [Gammaproteobacteria bacterium]